MSTLDAPWGGSEVLWSETALYLRRCGHQVSASVRGWPQRPPQVLRIAEAGVTLDERKSPVAGLWPSTFWRTFDPVVEKMARRSFEAWLEKEQPGLVCVSQGSIADDQSLIGIITGGKWRYATVLHANAEWIWPDDQRATDLMDFYRNARRAFFVSEGNRRMLEAQLGAELKDAETVRNPMNVRRDAAPPWPGHAEPVRLACVGRLDPSAKGQDLLFHVLAGEPWRSRPIRLSLFGNGSCEEGLRRLAARLHLQDRVEFRGHVGDIEAVWADHHALVLPSRFEGLPITIVEAMHCGRPVIVTDVAGNAEVVEDGVTGFVADAPTERHLHQAMERAWQARQNWQSIGQAAARSIRALMPEDPAAEFGRKLLELAA